MAPPRPRVEEPQTFGNVKSGSFWVEYPSGLVDLTCANPLESDGMPVNPPQKSLGQLDIAVEGDRMIRVDVTKTAIVIVDMQNFFLHPELRVYPLGLACVDPLLKVVPGLRSAGARIIWLNWGLTPTELTTIPPALARSFTKDKRGGFGSDLGAGWGPLLMRGARNSDLYGPLQNEWIKGREAGTDVWIHKNRRHGGLWGSGTALDLYLKEEGLKTLLFSGVNTDQCVLGTMVDAYFNGYDVVVVKDTTATPSPEGLSNVLHNSERTYGFVTDSERLMQAIETKHAE
ncbi:Isochorismatase hydrolase [Gautieria morchelliformis]|nr:Isochorismatase hydrolase [Gautieria morchelliformis]